MLRCRRRPVDHVTAVRARLNTTLWHINNTRWIAYTTWWYERGGDGRLLAETPVRVARSPGRSSFQNVPQKVLRSNWLIFFVIFGLKNFSWNSISFLRFFYFYFSRPTRVLIGYRFIGYDWDFQRLISKTRPFVPFRIVFQTMCSGVTTEHRPTGF